MELKMSDQVPKKREEPFGRYRNDTDKSMKSFENKLFKKVLKLIKKYDRIIIHRHNYPDGDALGSQIGLATIIKENFPKKEVYIVGDAGTRLSFMKGNVMDVIPDDYYKGALAIILDCGSSKLISDERYKTADMTIRFDHHLYVEKIASVDVVDSDYESCCGLVTAFAKTCKLKLSPLSAESLYTGMVTDSGRFMFDSTTARTFELASYLLSVKFDLNALYYNLYAEDFDKLLEKADNIKKIKFTQHNVAYIFTSKEELAEINASASVVSTGLVGVMKNIKNVFVWANFTESEEEIRVEIRSNRYNINPIAVKYGGGGHKKASGCTVHTREEVAALINDLDELATTPFDENI